METKTEEGHTPEPMITKKEPIGGNRGIPPPGAFLRTGSPPRTSGFVVNLDVYKIDSDRENVRTEVKMRIRLGPGIMGTLVRSAERMLFTVCLKFRTFHRRLVPLLIQEIVTFPLLPRHSLSLKEANEILSYQLLHHLSGFNALDSIKQFDPVLPSYLPVEAFYIDAVRSYPEDVWNVHWWQVPKSGCYRWSDTLGTFFHLPVI